MFQNERGELQARIDVCTLATCFTVKRNITALDLNDSLGVLARSAKHELVDKAVEVVLELGGIVSSVDNPAIIRWINIGLRTKFEAEILDEIF